MVNYPELLARELRKGSIKDQGKLDLLKDQISRLSWPSKVDFIYLENSGSSPKEWVTQAQNRILETSKKLATLALLTNKEQTLLELPLDWLSTLLQEGSLLSTKDAQKLARLAGVTIEAATSDALGPKDPHLVIKKEDAATALQIIKDVGSLEEQPLQLPLTHSAELVNAELKELLRQDTSGLGAVFRLLDSGITSPTAISKAGAAGSAGAASNQVARIKALLSGQVPESPEIKNRLVASIPGMLKSHPNMTPELSSYLTDLLAHTKTLQATSSTGTRKETKSSRARGRKSPARKSTTKAEPIDKTLQVYSLPLPDGTTVGVETPLWLKLGPADNKAASDIPGELTLLRSYSHKALSVLDLKGEFIRIMTTAEVEVPKSNPGAQGWYKTTLGNLDRIFSVLGGTALWEIPEL